MLCASPSLSCCWLLVVVVVVGCWFGVELFCFRTRPCGSDVHVSREVSVHPPIRSLCASRCTPVIVPRGRRSLKPIRTVLLPLLFEVGLSSSSPRHQSRRFLGCSLRTSLRLQVSHRHVDTHQQSFFGILPVLSLLLPSLLWSSFPPLVANLQPPCLIHSHGCDALKLCFHQVKFIVSFSIHLAIASLHNVIISTRKRSMNGYRQR